MEQIHIVWLTENYHPGRGGMAQSCDRIVHSLRSLGVTIDVIHFTRRLDRLRIESRRNGRDIGVPATDDPAHGFNLLWNALEIDPHRETFTHLVAFGGTTPLLAAPLLAAWLDLPLVTLFRGNDFDTGIFSIKRSELVRRAIEASTCLCVVSRDKERKIRALYPNALVRWITNGIDRQEWRMIDSDRQRGREWRSEAVPEGRKVLGMFGQIKQKKGGLFFLESLLLSGHADRFHLLFVGELEEGVISFLIENHDTISFTTVPFADRFDLLPWYAACDMIVIPSFYDGTPNVLLEAAALGVPLLASTAGGMGDMLVDGEHGYLFHPGDIHECRHAIERAAMATEQELMRLGGECLSLVEDGYDHITEAERYSEVFISTMIAGQNGSRRNGIHRASHVSSIDHLPPSRRRMPDKPA